MRHIINRVERADDFEVIIQLLFRRVLAKVNVIRIITLQQYRRLGWYASHEHDCLEPPINGRQYRSPMSTGAVAHVRNAVRINIRPRSKQIYTSPEIDD